MKKEITLHSIHGVPTTTTAGGDKDEDNDGDGDKDGEEDAPWDEH